MRIIFWELPEQERNTGETVSRKLNIPTISTGNIIRAAIKDGTKMGLPLKNIPTRACLFRTMLS